MPFTFMPLTFAILLLEDSNVSLRQVFTFPFRLALTLTLLPFLILSVLTVLIFEIFLLVTTYTALLIANFLSFALTATTVYL